LLGQIPTGSIPWWPWWRVLLLTTGRHRSRPCRSTTTLRVATHLYTPYYRQNTKQWVWVHSVPKLMASTAQNIVKTGLQKVW
jgi:hypothetical protein